MNPDDDPEARIRQLESSAAQYGAVELGTGRSGSAGPAPTSALPPPVYGAPPVHGDPYAVPPIYGGQHMPVKRKGSPIGLIVGLIVVAVVVVFGFIAIIAWNTMSNIESATTPPGGSSVSGGGGPVDGPSAGAPTSEAPSVAPGRPGDSGVLTAPPGTPLSVAGVDAVETVACDGNVVNVSGVSNNVTITGHCTHLSVSGVENVVVIDSVDSIGASGFDNRVIYRSGAPQIDATDSNVVAQG